MQARGKFILLYVSIRMLLYRNSSHVVVLIIAPSTWYIHPTCICVGAGVYIRRGGDKASLITWSMLTLISKLAQSDWP